MSETPLIGHEAPVSEQLMEMRDELLQLTVGMEHTEAASVRLVAWKIKALVEDVEALERKPAQTIVNTHNPFASRYDAMD